MAKAKIRKRLSTLRNHQHQNRELRKFQKMTWVADPDLALKIRELSVREGVPLTKLLNQILHCGFTHTDLQKLGYESATPEFIYQ